MTQRAAVYAALQIIGDQTSLSQLAQAASNRYGGPIGLSACSTFRGEWRKANGKDTDCRTYSGQPERNMLKGQADSQQGRALVEFVNLVGQPNVSKKVRLNRLDKLLAAFSGLDQLRQTAKQLEQYIALNELFAA